jgi:hypothetical protein
MSMAIHDPVRPVFQDLQHHCGQCAAARGRLHGLRCMAEAAGAFLAPRFVTALLAVGMLVLIGLSLPLLV